jgi:hypothetical protein
MAVAELPQGSPGGKGVSLDPKVPGTKTFTKPLDDTVEHPKKDESIWHVENPRDMAKDRSQVDVNDNFWDESTPSSYGLGDHSLSPKTKYPYRDDKARTAEFVAGLWQLRTAPERLLIAGLRIRVASPVETLLSGLNPRTQQRARSCKATLKRADIPNLRWIFSVDCGNGAKVVKFKAARKGNVKKFHKMDFHIACSCPAWRWQGPEFHSTTKDFQDPRTPLQGTASPPDIRDPNRTNMVCKHVASVLFLTRAWTIPVPKKRK